MLKWLNDKLVILKRELGSECWKDWKRLKLWNKKRKQRFRCLDIVEEGSR